MVKEIRVSIDRIVWRTRGSFWDYLFLLAPDLGVPSWYNFIKDISDKKMQEGAIGKIVHKNGNHRFFLFSIFIDPEFHDRVNRPIQHLFILFIQEHECQLMPDNWHEQVYLQVKDIYKSAFNLSQDRLESLDNIELYLRQYVKDNLVELVIKMDCDRLRNRVFQTINLSDSQSSTSRSVTTKTRLMNLFSADAPKLLFQYKISFMFYLLSMAIVSIISYMLGFQFGLEESDQINKRNTANKTVIIAPVKQHPEQQNSKVQKLESTSSLTK